MWIDVLVNKPLALPVLRAALAQAMGVPLEEFLVTESIEGVARDAPETFVVEATSRQGRYPQLLSIYAAAGDRPSAYETREIIGKFAEIAGVTCLASLEGMAETEMLEIRSRDQVRVVDADDADEQE